MDTRKNPKKGAAKVKHLGRRKAQIQRYYERTYTPRKLRHLLRNNGVAAARAWAQAHGELAVLHRLAIELGIEV